MAKKKSNGPMPTAEAQPTQMQQLQSDVVINTIRQKLSDEQWQNALLTAEITVLRTQLVAKGIAQPTQTDTTEEGEEGRTQEE